MYYTLRTKGISVINFRIIQGVTHEYGLLDLVAAHDVADEEQRRDDHGRDQHPVAEKVGVYARRFEHRLRATKKAVGNHYCYLQKKKNECCTE